MADTDGAGSVVTREDAEEGIVVLRLDRPGALNAMTDTLVAQLGDRLRAIAADPRVRVVVLTGEGRGFCAGHDLTELQGVAAAADDADAQLAHQRSYSDLVVQIAELPQPVVAAVNGPAAGGGLALALACDTRVCSPTARFNAAAIRLGISSCDVGISYLLPRVVGPTAAFEMMLTGRLIDADEALRLGLVLRVVGEDDVVGEAVGIARAIAENTALAVRLTKRTMWANLEAISLRQSILLEDHSQVLALQSGEWRDAMPAMAARTHGKTGT